jgi:hypothetical protein
MVLMISFFLQVFFSFPATVLHASKILTLSLQIETLQDSISIMQIRIGSLSNKPKTSCKFPKTRCHGIIVFFLLVRLFLSGYYPSFFYCLSCKNYSG